MGENSIEPGEVLSGFVRLKDIIGPRGPLPISKSSWLARVKSGEFPQPVKLGPKTIAWRVSDIRRLLQQFGSQP
ncbi:AlpA family phage regulatory protein [Mesorhizobium sp. M0041]|uniref:helix-turn-helix transcriptional regulator n=1 Tax=Mesorhizobium sp. M0041 TaxID=2956856 RepID=UPI003339DCE1